MNSNMMNKVAFIDIDGTLIRGQSQRLFIEFLMRKGFLTFPDFAYIYAWFFLYKLGITDNPGHILDFALRNLKGIESSRIDSLMNRFYDEKLMNRVRAYSAEAVDELKAKGYRVLLLSTAVEPIVRLIARKLGIQGYICTKVEIDHAGRYTGNILESQVYKGEKRKRAEEYLKQNDLIGARTLAIADHKSDKELLLFADKAIVANPDSAMRKWATENKIDMIYFEKNESVQYIKSHIESQ